MECYLLLAGEGAVPDQQTFLLWAAVCTCMCQTMQLVPSMLATGMHIVD